MPIYRGGTEIPQVLGNIQSGDTDVDTVYVGDSIVWTARVARRFAIEDAGIAFSISEAGIVSLSIETGTLSNTRVDGVAVQDGTDVGTVTEDTERFLTGQIIVPNDPMLWTNAGQFVQITGVSAIQDAVDVSIMEKHISGSCRRRNGIARVL